MTKLAPREKRLIMIMFTIMIMMTTIPIYRNITNKHAQSVRQLSTANERLESARIWRDAIISEREGQKVIQAKLNARGDSFDLYSLTNQIIKQTDLSSRADIKSKGPGSNEAAFEGVQVTLRRINMEELIDFLHKMYNSNNLIIMQRMPFLHPSPDGKGLECSIELIAPRKQ